MKFFSNIKSIGFFVGLSIFLITLLTNPPAGLSVAAWHVAGISMLMAIWWATETIPLPVTALLPLALFPIFQIYGPYEEGIFSAKDAFTMAAKPYAHPNIFLFLGGFILALGIEKVNLHKRMALSMLILVGTNTKYLIGGFMLVSAVISMWIMNTSTTLMLLPIALAIAAVIHKTTETKSEEEFNNFQTSLLLGVAYAATIGGMATTIGTGPNVLVKSFLEDEGIQVYFGDWMLLATPMSAIMLLCGWFLLTHIVFPVNIKGSPETSNALNDMYKELGDMRSDERRVLIIFAFTAFAWMFSKLLVQLPFLTGLTDYGIAIFAALAIFITRSSSGEGLIDWKTTKNLPWGILLLFGGGLSMAGAIKSSMLGDWIGSFFSSDISAILLIFIIVTLIVFLTELTSNQATTATFVPIMIAIAGSDIGLVSQLAIPVALAASCAFMLPVATPPNAIVYGSEKFTIAQMMKAGFYLNVIGILVVTLFSAYVLPLIF